MLLFKFESVRAVPQCVECRVNFLTFMINESFVWPFSFVPSLARRIFQFSLSVLCRHRKRCRCIQCVMYDAHNPLNEQSHFLPPIYLLLLPFHGTVKLCVCSHWMRQCDKKDIRGNKYICAECAVCAMNFKVLNACCRECSLSTFLIAEVKA